MDRPASLDGLSFKLLEWSPVDVIDALALLLGEAAFSRHEDFEGLPCAVNKRSRASMGKLRVKKGEGVGYIKD